MVDVAQGSQVAEDFRLTPGIESQIRAIGERQLVGMYRALPEEEQFRVWEGAADATMRANDPALIPGDRAVGLLQMFGRSLADGDSQEETCADYELSRSQYERLERAWHSILAVSEEVGE